jgi:hypothetical protein
MVESAGLHWPQPGEPFTLVDTETNVMTGYIVVSLRVDARRAPTSFVAQRYPSRDRPEEFAPSKEMGWRPRGCSFPSSIVWGQAWNDLASL